jgi:hypothetical protein
MMKWSTEPLTRPEPAGEKPENRRSGYRIDDDIILLYDQIPAGEGPSGDLSPTPEPAPGVLLCARMAEHRHQVHRLLREVQKDALSVFKSLKALEEEIDLLANVLLVRELASFASSKRRVKLSASGVAFPTERQLDEGALLLLQMVLLPSFAGIISEARVVRSTPFLSDTGRQFLTTVEFVKMRESTRDILVRHILDRQKELVRRAQDGVAGQASA